MIVCCISLAHLTHLALDLWHFSAQTGVGCWLGALWNTSAPPTPQCQHFSCSGAAKGGSFCSIHCHQLLQRSTTLSGFPSLTLSFHFLLSLHLLQWQPFLQVLMAPEFGGQFWWELLFSRIFPCLLASFTHRGTQLLQLFPSSLKPLQCIYFSACTEPSQAPSSQTPALAVTRIPPKKPMITMPWCSPEAVQQLQRVGATSEQQLC